MVTITNSATDTETKNAISESNSSSLLEFVELVSLWAVTSTIILLLTLTWVN